MLEVSRGYVRNGQSIVNSMIDIDNIFIIHYNKAIERKKYLDTALPNLEIPYSYRCKYDRNSPEILSNKYFDQSIENKKKRNEVLAQYQKSIEEGMPLEWGERGRAYRAVTLEHYKTYEFVINNTTFENILILEDDVRLQDNSKHLLQQFLQALPDDYDTCYIGSGCNLQLPYTTNKILDKHPLHHSKCSDSYIISRKAIEKVVKTALPFFGAIDWELNYLQALNKLNVYWTTVPAVYQGSQHGHYESCFHILE